MHYIIFISKWQEKYCTQQITVVVHQYENNHQTKGQSGHSNNAPRQSLLQNKNFSFSIKLKFISFILKDAEVSHATPSLQR